MKPSLPKLIPLLLLVILLLPFPLRSARLPDAHAAIEQALLLAEQDDIEHARLVMQTIPETGLPDALISTARGAIELRAGNVDSAALLFTRALEKDPRQLAARWGMALCFLHAGQVFAATTSLEQAAVLAPDDSRIMTLRAYLSLLIGQVTDAAALGKAALDAGERSPMLMAVLAQVHALLGYPDKAVEFGDYAARAFVGVNLSADKGPLSLPLTMLVTDTPAALTPIGTTAIQVSAPVPMPALSLPAARPLANEEDPALLILSPQDRGTLHGAQTIQAYYRGDTPLRFLTLSVNGALRGLLSALPYHFAWDADSVLPGKHSLQIRAYDAYGVLAEQATITVVTTAGTAGETVELPARALALQQRMMALTMPMPAALSLHAALSNWHRARHELPQAIDMLEKAAAIDPENAMLTATLQQMYRENGLHALTANGQITHGLTTRKEVALTFDDGPNPLYVSIILQELARYQAQATFFLVGKMVHKYPELTRDLLASGHELANHTYNHPNITRLSTPALLREILLDRAAIKDVTGRNTVLFRPPGGNIDSEVARQLHALDYNIVYWNINAGDYRKLVPAEQASRILARVEPGSIILLHCGPIDGTMDILPTLLRGLATRGYRCVTVSQLFRPAQ